jgi:hypothetical protein
VRGSHPSTSMRQSLAAAIGQDHPPSTDRADDSRRRAWSRRAIAVATTRYAARRLPRRKRGALPWAKPTNCVCRVGSGHSPARRIWPSSESDHRPSERRRRIREPRSYRHVKARVWICRPAVDGQGRRGRPRSTSRTRAGRIMGSRRARRGSPGLGSGPSGCCPGRAKAMPLSRGGPRLFCTGPPVC